MQNACGDPAGYARHDRLARPAVDASQRPVQLCLPGRRWANRRLRRQALPLRRRHPLRAALVQALAARGPRHDPGSSAMNYPLGDIRFDCGGVKIGFEICEDAWVANRPGGELALRGVDSSSIPAPATSPSARSKSAAVRARRLAGVRRQLRLRQPARQRSGPCHLRRRRADRFRRQLLAAGPRLSFADWHVTTRRDRRRRHSHEHRSRWRAFSRSWAGRIRLKSFARSNGLRSNRSQPSIAAAEWETSPHLKEEEFARAIALALFDYLRKSRSRGFVVVSAAGPIRRPCPAWWR